MLQYWKALFLEFPWLGATLEIAFLIVAAWALRKFGITWLRRLASRSRTTLDEEFVELANRALVPFLVLGVLDVVLNLQVFSPKPLALGNRVLYLGVLIVAIYYTTKAIRLFLEHWLAGKPSRASIREPTLFAARVAFATFGIMIILDNLGVSLTAVWTTLGIGSIAIALALQDTLSNFFAGVYVHLDSPVRVGDYVKLEETGEGIVTQIGWRSTRIRTLRDNTVVVPNAKLASAVVTNFSLPEAQMSVSIQVPVSYSADPDEVERILVEEAERGAAEIPGMVSDPKPLVRFLPGYGENALKFSVICRVNSFVEQYLVEHELHKRIFCRFRKEGIEMASPQRDVLVLEKDWPRVEAEPNGRAMARPGQRK